LIYKILLIVILNNFIFSQSYIDNLVSHYKSIDTYIVEFDYITTRNSKILLKNEGKILFSNNKYRILIDDVIFIYDGEKHFNIIEENKEVNVSKDYELSNYIIPSKISEIILINKSKIQIQSIGKNTIITYNSDFKYKINIDNNYTINSLEQHINEENINTIIFKKSTLNQSLSDDLFKFRKNDYKDYYINNL
tara:strand:- start:3433 stop:4011 length:579 start_codon:yes stop_codon:yes gene_type:complete